MPLKLYPPGTRKGNRVYYAVGRVLGVQVERALDTTNARTAEQRAKALEHAVRAEVERQRREAAVEAGRPATFRDVAADYQTTRGIDGGNEAYYLARLCDVLGDMPVAEVTQADIERAAFRLYPDHKAATRNRQAFTPAARVLHWAAESGLRDYLRVRKLREEKPRSRRPAAGAIESVIAETDGAERLLLTVLWGQGWRITETLAMTWEDNVRLADQEFDMYVRKAKAWKVVQMQADVLEALAAVPEAERTGRLFPWSDRFAVYRWLRPLCRRLGVRFTPHMARHEFASSLNAVGATNASIAAAGSWTSVRSVERYTEVDREEVRDTLGKRGTLGKVMGKPGKAQKA